MSPTTVDSRKLIPIVGVLKDYAWGLPGAESLASALHCSNSGDSVDSEKPAAELWLGTHSSGPSQAKEGNASLRDAIGGDLPFLLKVLSVARPLSIQAHPDKARAERLHAERPDKYKDDNHKPEMAVAITPFEGMCNFRNLSDIAASIESLPPLSIVLGKPAKAFVAAGPSAGPTELREVFSALMRASPDAVTAALSDCAEIVRAREADDADSLFLRLAKFYPGDVGAFCAYFLNHVRAAPGEAFFMGANEPHAYLSGQCVEVMACSDNVVRAGLTPKFKDVDNLVEMLTYRSGVTDMVQTKLEKGTAGTGHVYRPPGIDEFQLVRYKLQPSVTAEVPRHKNNSIIFVVEGDSAVFCGGVRTEAPAGFAACLKGDTDASIAAGENGAVVFRASVNQERVGQ